MTIYNFNLLSFLFTQFHQSLTVYFTQVLFTSQTLGITCFFFKTLALGSNKTKRAVNTMASRERGRERMWVGFLCVVLLCGLTMSANCKKLMGAGVVGDKLNRRPFRPKTHWKNIGSAGTFNGPTGRLDSTREVWVKSCAVQKNATANYKWRSVS